MKKLLLLVTACLMFSVNTITAQTPVINQNYDHSITLTDASQMTYNYRHSVSTSATKAVIFTKAALTEILQQENCAGAAFYFAKDANGVLTLVIVGVDDQAYHMYNGVIKERGLCCTAVCLCSASNPLSTD